MKNKIDWIDVNVQIPEENEYVRIKFYDGKTAKAELNYTMGSSVGLEWYSKSGIWYQHGNITHWAKL
jgi:hypothetical protein